MTHKRRGRPPLKAEEGSLRTYEPTLGQPVAPRSAQQGSTQAGSYTHRRNTSSRELRPNTELQQHRQLINPRPESGHLVSTPIATIPRPPYPPQFPSQANPPPTLIQRPAPSGPFRQVMPHNAPTAFPSNRTEIAPRNRSESSRRHLTGPEIRHLQSPQQSRQLFPHSPSLAHSAQSQGRKLLPAPHPHPQPLPHSLPTQGLSSLRLPPILPSVTRSDAEVSPRSQGGQTLLPPSWPSRRPPDTLECNQEHGNRNLQPSRPPFQLAPLSTASVTRRATDPQISSSPSFFSQHQPLMRHHSIVTTTHQVPERMERAVSKEREENKEDKPVKRRKMTLGEMVND